MSANPDPLLASGGTPPNTAIYRRVSTDKQDDSLELQEKRNFDYANYKGLITSEHLTFADPDTSGSVPFAVRDGGRALMNRLRLGDIRHLVVAKLDRIGRNVRDALGFLEFCAERDITVHITDFGGDAMSTQGHIGKMILTILLAVAEWELGEIRDRTTKVMRQKFANRELTGNVPYGWDVEYCFQGGHTHRSAIALSTSDLAPLITLHGGLTSKQLVDNFTEQEIIRQLAAWKALKTEGGMFPVSYTQVATWANERGYRTKQGHEWSQGNARSVLLNRHTARLLADKI